MIAAAVALGAQLRHAQPAPLRPIFERGLLEENHPVRDAGELQVVIGAAHVVQQHHRAAPADEEVLDGEHLPPEPQRVLREQPHLGERIEHEAARLEPFDGIVDRPHRLPDFDIGRMKDGVLQFRLEHFIRRGELEDLEAGERPAMARRDLLELAARFRERDVERRLATQNALHEELEGERRLACPGSAFDEEEVVRRKSTAEDIIETGDPGRR